MQIAGKKVHWSVTILGIVLGFFIIVQAIVFFVLQPLVGQVIRSSVSYFSDDIYQIDFNRLRVELFRKAIELEGVVLTYDTARVHQSANLRQGKQYTGTARHVRANLHEFAYFLSGRYLAVDAIEIIQPTIYAHYFPETSSRDTTQRDSTLEFNTYQLIKPYFDSVYISVLNVDEASVGAVQHHGPTLSDTTAVREVSITIREAQVDSVTASRRQGWPSMKEFTLGMRDQTFVSADSLYEFQIDSAQADPLRGTLSVKQFSVVPRWDRYEMGEHLGRVANWVQLDISQITAREVDFPLLTDSMRVRLDRLDVDQANFTLFRDLRLPSGESKKRPLLQEQMQSAPFTFQLDTITLASSLVAYEERHDSTDQAGRIAFEDLYASFYNVTNTPIDSAAVMSADVRTRLMGEGDAELHFTFPLTSTRGEHQITGQLDRMSLAVLNPTIEPLAFTSIKSGIVNRMDFNMQLDEEYATGSVRFQYENLKLSLLQEGEPDDKKGVKSWLANLLVVKDSNPVRTKPLRPGPISFEREPTKSMFNYWWRALRSGLEVSVGVKKAPANTQSAGE